MSTTIAFHDHPSTGDMTRGQRFAAVFFLLMFGFGLAALCFRFLVPEAAVTDGPAEADFSFPTLIALGISVASLYVASRD